MRSGLLFACVLTLLLPVVVAAQSLDGLTDTSSFAISASPDYPTPYGKATLSFLSSSLDLANATLSVSIGGKSIYSGSVQPVAVTLGKAGSVVRVVATISSNGSDYTETLSLQPQDITLVAEPAASVPPLYPGKPLVPLEGSVRVVAVANLKNSNGITVNPSALSYAWTVDDTRIANASGIGKTAIVVASPMQYRTRTVSVTVMSQDGALVGGASLSLSAEEPSVRLYENDPLLGIRFDRALSDKLSIKTESSLYAAVYSLPIVQEMPLLQWFLNGAPAQTGNSITLRSTGSGQGSASLSFVASSGDYAKATASLPVVFGEKTSTNFFGL